MSGDTLARRRRSFGAPIRIVCADAQRLFTIGVRSVLTATSQVQIVGDAEHGELALRLVERLKPDVLVIDLALSGMPALEVLDHLATRRSATRAVVVTDDVGTQDLRTALVRGARGVLERHVAPSLFVKCIRKVAAGEFWIGRAHVADLVEALRQASPAAPPPTRLSKRERDIVEAVVRGASNKEIGAQLGLGEQTVKNHLRRAFEKLRVANRVELAIKLSDRGRPH
jgi:DNA-binding NarL/FixJ family response regulator